MISGGVAAALACTGGLFFGGGFSHTGAAELGSAPHRPCLGPAVAARAGADARSGMTEQVELVQNAAARMVPAMVNGKPQIPYLGAAKYQPRGRKAAPPVRSSRDYPDDGNKRVPDLESALRKCGLRDGMVISNHHHLRDGDRVAVMMLETAARMGVQDLTWFPSASFPSQKAVIGLMQ